MFYSLRNRFFLIFTCLLTVPFILLSILIPSLFTSVIKDQTQNLVKEKMEQYSLYVESITKQAQDLGKQVLINQTTQDWLKLETGYWAKSNEEILLKKKELGMLLNSIRINNSNDMSVSVFLYDGTGAPANNLKLKEENWYIDFMVNEQNFIKSHIDHPSAGGESINSYILPLFNLSTLESSGIIKVNFPSSLFESALDNMLIGKKGHAYLIDSSGSNVLQNKIQIPDAVIEKTVGNIGESRDKKGLIEMDYQGETYFVFYHMLPVGDWIFISEVTKSNLFSEVNNIQNNLLIISAIVFLLTIFTSYMLSSNITKPIGKLTKAMGYIEHGDFHGAQQYLPTIKSNNHEVGYLVKVFKHTIGRLKSLIETEYEANLRRKDAEYKALLLQINPHFLNNTLEIIGGLAAQGKNREVMKISVYLGKMMRYSLNTKSNIVRLGEEMNYIRNYTNILKLRYEDNINIEIEEDSEIRQIPIIKFILQPLVENAVKYSFVEKKNAEIYISTKRVDDQIFLSIEDKGVGISDDVIKDLMRHEDFNETNNVLESKGNSIGLKNVIGRLLLYYGKNFSYKIESKENEGTRITLCIYIKRGDFDVEGDHYR
ncbi:MAG TPA: histidine kinase [Bacillaceae bacterium]|nr:histidine kinase [Bacillaceae bacterium]